MSVYGSHRQSEIETGHYSEWERGKGGTGGDVQCGGQGWGRQHWLRGEGSDLSEDFHKFWCKFQDFYSMINPPPLPKERKPTKEDMHLLLKLKDTVDQSL